MGFFEKFFSRKGVTKELELADWEIIGIWKNYLQSVERKSKIVQQMTSENYATFLDQLKELVDLELVEITDEENYGKKYVEDIQRIEHDERIQRVKRLEQTLFYVESKHRYLDKLLEQLHEVLRLQKYYVDSLSGLTVHSFLPALAKTVQEEEAIIKEADLPDFHELFLAIAKGEAMVKRMRKKTCPPDAIQTRANIQPTSTKWPYLRMGECSYGRAPTTNIFTHTK